LAEKHQTQLKINVDFKQADTSRTLGLSHFNIFLESATPEEIKHYSPTSILFKKILSYLPLALQKFYKERQFSYQPDFEKLGPNVYLKGYWQSERYFSTIATQVKDIFTLQPHFYSNILPLIEEIKQTESVSIHVRKGDYLLHPYSDYYATLESAYYNNALAALQDNLPQLKLYVFTDDPKWVKENLALPIPYTLISGVQTRSMYEDFQAMLSCKYHIIANSSFSWWTAWLSAREGKKVVAPKEWFKNGPSDTADLIPKSWLIV
jgi:hypothetical protein